MERGEGGERGRTVETYVVAEVDTPRIERDEIGGEAPARRPVKVGAARDALLANEHEREHVGPHGRRRRERRSQGPGLHEQEVRGSDRAVAPAGVEEPAAVGAVLVERAVCLDAVEPHAGRELGGREAHGEGRRH
jgi:hypothetical protein